MDSSQSLSQVAGNPTVGPAVRDRLLALIAEDDRVRAELAADESLFGGYHPRMREVHERNAAALEEIIAALGWPGVVSAGADGAAAAWRIAQHAIGMPAFQRRCLALIEDAVARGDADPKHAAYLDDRIALNAGRPQRFGTQFDWDEDGNLSPLPLDAPDTVDRRRGSLGLAPLAEQVEAMRAAARAKGERPPPDWRARRREMDEWARDVGWRNRSRP